MSEEAEGRGRRKVSAKLASRLSALDKLKQLKGGKNKYEVKDEDDVYDQIDEDEYSELVSKRVNDDWIVDDGTGYYDDGREIFDDDLDEEVPVKTRHNYNRGSSNKTPTSRNAGDSNEQSESVRFDIRSMFKKQAEKVDSSRKTLRDIKVDESDVKDILSEIYSKNDNQPSFSTPKAFKLPKKTCSSSAKSFHLPSNPFASRGDQSFDLTPKQLKRKNNSEGSQLKRRSLAGEIKKEIDFLTFLNDDEFDKFDDEAIKNCDDVEMTPTDERVDSKIDMNESIDWTSTTENQIGLAPVPSILPKEVPFETDKDNNKWIKFYWFDAFTDNFKNPGIVYLFGKIWIKQLKKHVSSCIIIKNIERRIYFLPRSTFKEDSSINVTFEDVYGEFKCEIAKKFKINDFKHRKVTKKYAFEMSDVPFEAEYLEISYPYKLPALPSDLSGNTFSHVFGTTTSSLEKILLEIKMKGPCWLRIMNPEISDPPVSWCKIELIANNANLQIEVESEQAPAPEFTLLSINLRTFVNPNKNTEIVGIACLVNRSFFIDKSNESKYDSHFCAITKPSNSCEVDLPYDFKQNYALKDYKKTKVESMSSERELLNFFMAKLQQLDPDIIVGHDVYNFDYELLLSRLNYYKISSWSKLGRLKRSGLPVKKTKEKANLCGRILCDIKISSKELLRAKSYDLTELSVQILRKSRFEVEQETLKNYYANSKQLLRLVDLIMKDNDLILNIFLELNALPLALQITKIAGNLLSRTLLGGRSERNEYLLLHAFYEKNFICPDKIFASTKKNTEEADDEVDEDKNKAIKRKAAYTGGLVLDPRVGFYDRFILLMDFNSLYPSIIQEYNICFTTVSRTSIPNENDTFEEFIPELPNSELEIGILPTEIKKLVESRREAKKLMCQPGISHELKQQYDIKQKALKLTANSMYGCLGFSNSRFYAKPLAALITFKGREILMNTKQLVENLGLEVIYGDTDSLMILTSCLDFDEVKSIGSKIQNEVNRLYKLLEIEIDGVFRSILLLKKKKYAALTAQKLANGEITYSKEVKGLDIVRRDWAVIAKNAGQQVLNEILSLDKASNVIVDNIHNYLKNLSVSVKSGDVPIEEFVINKALTKNPEDYPENKALSHVTVALRYNRLSKNKKLLSGDTVPYIICEDVELNNGNLPATQRAYHPDELKENANLKIDIKYYLSQQIFPVVSRLCDPIDGTNAGSIAEFLGVENDVKITSSSKVTEHFDYDPMEPVDLDFIFKIFKKL